VRWNGTQWSMSAHVAATAVSCTSPTFCFALAGATPTYRWNGAAWSEVSGVPPPSGLGGFGIDGVSCPTASSCVAVGVSVEGLLDFRSLTQRWDGTHWTTAGGVPGQVSAVWCSTSTACLSVGSSDDSGSGQRPNADAARLDGTSWQPSIPCCRTDSKVRSAACRASERRPASLPLSSAASAVPSTARPRGCFGCVACRQPTSRGLFAAFHRVNLGARRRVGDTSRRVCLPPSSVVGDFVLLRHHPGVSSEQSAPGPPS